MCCSWTGNSCLTEVQRIAVRFRGGVKMCSVCYAAVQPCSVRCMGMYVHCTCVLYVRTVRVCGVPCCDRACACVARAPLCMRRNALSHASRSFSHRHHTPETRSHIRGLHAYVYRESRIIRL